MSIHVSLTLTYDVQILICYQNGRLKFVKITNVSFEGTFSIFILLQELLSEWPLTLIMLSSYTTGNSIWSSANRIIYNINII